MNIIKGNLIKLALSGEARIIVHGCNCFHAMGSGIDGQLAAKFPEIPQADYRTPKGFSGKLTNYSIAEVTYQKGKKGGPLEDFKAPVMFDITHPFTCINLYTQYNPGSDFLPSLFPEALKRLNEDFKGKRLWFPRVGAGIAKGDWMYIEDCLLNYLPNVHVSVVVL